MKPNSTQSTRTSAAGQPARRQRFRIEKLEERIAPSNWKGNGAASKNCPPSQGGSRCSV
jgi:hypothetical protein